MFIDLICGPFYLDSAACAVSGPARQCAQAAQAENHQLKICDVIGWDRGDRAGRADTDRERCPLCGFIPTVISKYQETETQFIGSQDHLDGRKLEKRLEQILEHIKRYQSQKLTFCF